MNKEWYNHATASTRKTILRLTQESCGKLDEDCQSHWDMANGAFQCWLDLFDGDVAPTDRRQLEQLLDDMGIAQRN